MMNYIPQDQSKVKELLKKVVDENKILNSLDRNILLQLAAPFNSQDRKVSDPSDILIKLKGKIIEICDSEKSQCIDYLTLPKFSNLSEKAYNLFREILQEVWSQFSTKSKELQSLQKISTLLCKSDNIQEQENFHLKNLQLFRNSIMLQQNPMLAIQNYQQNFQNMMNPNMNIINQTNFPPLNMPQFGNNNNFNVNKKNAQGYQNQNQNTQQIVTKIEEVPPFSNNLLFGPKKNSKLQDGESSPFIVASSKKKVNTAVTPSQSVNTVNNKAFQFCVCKGSKGNNQKFIECQKCQKKYHLSCLHIPFHYTLKQNNNSKKKCPYCCMKQSTLFSQVIGEPLDYFWTSQKELGQKKITIKAKKCKEIVEKKYGICFRFLRIEGLEFFKEAQDSLMTEESVHNRISDILLNDSIFAKNTGEDVKINFDNAKVMRMQDPNAPFKQNFIAVCLIKPLKSEEAMSKVTETTDDSYLNSLFKDGQQELKIQISNHYGTSLIQKPCRGLQCTHPGVFDANEFVTHCIQNNYDDACFICKKKCKGLVVDKAVQNEIQKIREQNKEYPPDIIFFKKNKEFRWGEIVQSQGAMQGEEAIHIPQGSINFEDQIPNSDNDDDDDEMVD